MALWFDARAEMMGVETIWLLLSRFMLLDI